MADSDMRPSGLLALARRSINVYANNFPVMALLSLLLSALPVYLILTVGDDYSNFKDLWSLEMFCSLLGGTVLAACLQTLLTLVCFLHLTGSRPTFLEVIGQLRAALVLRAIGTHALMLIFLVPLFLALFIPGLVFAVRWSLIIPILVLERRAFRDALRRSSLLVLDHWWTLFGLITLLSALSVGIHVAKQAATLLGVSTFTSEVVSQVMSVLIYPLFLIANALFYCDMRVRKEGLEVETIREGLGLNVDMSEWRYRWDLPTRDEDWADDTYLRSDRRQEDNSASIDPQ